MILQYKGFNNSWCYEQASTIIWSLVWVGKETRDYREGGIRYDLLQKERSNKDFVSLNLQYVKELHTAVDKLIKNETNCGDEIIYLIGDLPFDEMENVCVVTLQDRGKPSTTYVFTKGVYLLNDSGGTVQKIV